MQYYKDHTSSQDRWSKTHEYNENTMSTPYGAIIKGLFLLGDNESKKKWNKGNLLLSSTRMNDWIPRGEGKTLLMTNESHNEYDFKIFIVKRNRLPFMIENNDIDKMKCLK